MNDMRNNIVERLRFWNGYTNGAHVQDMQEAADRIESLQAQLLEKDLILVTSNMALRERISQLEAAMMEIADRYTCQMCDGPTIARRVMERL